MTTTKKKTIKAALAKFNQNYELVNKNGRLEKKRKKATPKPIHATTSIMRKPKEK